ncbi:hypothetical protein O3P69_011436 [Scylla paramamosain]|uniref:Uncharacterized protein n=1 Tax=Scylla paramamosain TaxID=85552 RepID=A0AAW0T7D9_SCYPA
MTLRLPIYSFMGRKSVFSYSLFLASRSSITGPHNSIRPEENGHIALIFRSVTPSDMPPFFLARPLRWVSFWSGLQPIITQNAPTCLPLGQSPPACRDPPVPDATREARAARQDLICDTLLNINRLPEGGSAGSPRPLLPRLLLTKDRPLAASRRGAEGERGRRHTKQVKILLGPRDSTKPCSVPGSQGRYNAPEVLLDPWNATKALVFF